MNTLERSVYRDLIMEVAREQGIVRAASFELLDFCNYSCSHCYVRSCYNQFIDVSLFESCVDALSKIGCVWVLLTGGEPLMHPHFNHLYQYAFDRNLRVSVFTNGSLLSDEHIELFLQKPPEQIEISLYGHDSETHDAYSGVPGSFSAVMCALDKLSNLPINVKLKTVATRTTLASVDCLRKIASSRGLDFRFDGHIAPRIDGTSCDCHRLSPEDVLSCELATPGFLHAAKKIASKEVGSSLYSCAAGRNSLFFTAEGEICPCGFCRHICVSAEDYSGSVSQAQRMLLNLLGEKGDLAKGDACYECSWKNICHYCPGLFYLENGNERTPIAWNCEYAKNLSSVMVRLS